MSYTTTSTTVPAGPGSGPCALPPIGAVSACAQQTIAYMQNLSGVDADKAYLQAMIQLNLSVMALSNGSADHLGTTSLQDYATNSITDSRTSVNQAEKWLRTKYCLDVAACPPSLGPGFDICNLTHPGKEFDDSYKNQLVQFYVDEITLSQVEIQRGLDSQVKAWAAETIRNDQIRINRLRRCTVCGV